MRTLDRHRTAHRAQQASERGRATDCCSARRRSFRRNFSSVALHGNPSATRAGSLLATEQPALLGPHGLAELAGELAHQLLLPRREELMRSEEHTSELQSRG